MKVVPKVTDIVELQTLGNITMHSIWWLLLCDVSHKSKNHIACPHYVITAQCKNMAGEDMLFW